MKRFFCLLLSAIMLLTLFGCGSKEQKILEPINFYYRRSEIDFAAENALIAPLVVESAGFDEIIPLLKIYLRGCEDDQFHHTFPTGTELVDAYVRGHTLYLFLSSDFARLTGIDLSIACACITMTALELVDATYVCISANDVALDGAQSVTLSMEDLILEDTFIPENLD